MTHAERGTRQTAISGRAAAGARCRGVSGYAVGIGVWLRDLGLERYEPAFRDNDVEADILPELTAEDLLAIGVTSVGHRRKMLNAIAARRQEAIETATASSKALNLTSAERRQLTILICDLLASTELSRRLDPEDLADVMRGRRKANVLPKALSPG